MATKASAVLILGLTLLLAGALAAQQKPEDIPDAPSATRPIPPPAPPARGKKRMRSPSRIRRRRMDPA